MADLIIKDVPEGAEADVKRMAMVAVERYLRKDVKVAEEVQSKFETDLDAIRVANSMDKKYEVADDKLGEMV